ncbi:GNAT family N-acetyltransferase [Streptomyces sp. NPDC059991]|uniref:GNAT family N-acetyltransferase n=1 Tax=unclassified Streptomyces TaxID=2593676 RepID=UPI00369D2D58
MRCRSAYTFRASRTKTAALLAGVAVHPSARGRGLARTVVAKVLAEALAVHGTAALMVEGANRAAIGLYEGLGLEYRRFLAAELAPEGQPGGRTGGRRP